MNMELLPCLPIYHDSDVRFYPGISTRDLASACQSGVFTVNMMDSFTSVLATDPRASQSHLTFFFPSGFANSLLFSGNHLSSLLDYSNTTDTYWNTFLGGYNFDNIMQKYIQPTVPAGDGDTNIMGHVFSYKQWFIPVRLPSRRWVSIVINLTSRELFLFDELAPTCYSVGNQAAT